MNYINCDKCDYKNNGNGCSAEKCYSPSNIYHGTTRKIQLLLWAIQKRTPCNHLTSECTFRVMEKYCALCKGGCDKR